MEPEVMDTLEQCARSRAFGNRHDVWQWVDNDGSYYPLERDHMHKLIDLGYIEDADYRVGGGPPGTSVFNDWQLTDTGKTALSKP